MAIGDWMRLRSYRIARLWVEGYNRRWNTVWTVGWCISRAAVFGRAKVPKGYPYDLEAVMGEKSRVEDEMPEMSEAESDAKLEAMKAGLLKRMKGEGPAKDGGDGDA